MADMTPDRWRDKLLIELAGRIANIQLLERYYTGDHPLIAPPDRTSDEYRRFASMSQANMCALIVDAVTERLEVQGVRLRQLTDQELANGRAASDIDIWVDIWQANFLDADSSMVHEQALKVGRAFAMVWPVDGGVQITPEDPTEVIVAYAPGNKRERLAALKVYGDSDAGLRYATLWQPSAMYRWRQDLRDSAARWEPWDGEDGLGPEVANPLGRVPIVEFRCRPNLRNQVMPELAPGVLKVQDLINKTLFDRTVLSESQAFPQRYAIGIDVELDENGDPINPLKTGPQRVWTLQSDDPGTAKIGQLDAADFTGHLKTVESDIQHLAAMTKTPVYYLMGQMVNVSADAIRAAEAGLVQKVRRHQRDFGEAWEEVIRLALGALNDPRSDDVGMEIDWVNPEARSLAELVDAATKKSSIGVPWRQLMEDIGYSPQEIDRMNTERAADALLAVPAAPAAGAQ